MISRQIYITTEGIAKLREEYAHLTTVGRQEVAARLGAAADDGDLSENAAYDAAKEDQSVLEGRIAQLEQTLRHAVPIEQAAGTDKSRVGIGSTVTVVDVDEQDEEETYMIVSPVEAAPLKGRISHDSPMGRAILDRALGDEVKFEAPGGSRTLRITSVA